MEVKHVYRQFQRFIARTGIQFCSLIAKIIPQCFVYIYARFMGRVLYCFAVRHRRVAFESLSIAFADQKSKQEIGEIAIGCFDTIAKIAVEFLFFLERPYLINSYVTIEGIAHLDRALAKKKGVIALSAHFGNFPLLLTKLAMDGYKVHTILRHMRDQWLDDYLYKRRTAVGVGSIFTQPRKQCVDKSLEVLRNNQILFMQLDQNFGTGGVFVDFFGKKAATAKGPFVFAMRTNAAIVPMFIFREKENHQRIVIEPEVEIIRGKDSDDTMQRNAQELTTLIESYIRRYPTEWSWVHRRWKARPKRERVGKI